MMKTHKDRLIDELKYFIKSEGQWLAPCDQDAIMLKIEELDNFINKRYDDRKKLLSNAK